MTYRITRKDLGRAFKKAKPYLADGKTDKSKTLFICCAISQALDSYGPNYGTRIGAVANAARDIISERINREGTVDIWLVKQGVRRSQMTHAKLQAYRHRWLDLLIEEFSK